MTVKIPRSQGAENNFLTIYLSFEILQKKKRKSKFVEII